MGQLVPGRVAGGGKTLSYVWSVLTSQPRAGVAVGEKVQGEEHSWQQLSLRCVLGCRCSQLRGGTGAG